MYRWERVAQPEGSPGARRSHTLARYERHSENLLCFGGFQGAEALGDAWSLTLRLARDPAQGSAGDWAPRPDLAPPTPRHDHAFFRAGNDDALLAVGGMGADNAVIGATHAFDDAAARWTETRGGALPPRANATIARTRRGAICFGGYRGGDRTLADLWAFDAATRRWRPLHNGMGTTRRPSRRAGHGAVVVEGGGREVCYVFGGWDGGDTMLDDTWALDVARAETGDPGPWWEKQDCVGARPSPRACFSLTVVSRPPTGAVAATCALVGGLAPDWRARDAALYVMELPRPGSLGDVVWSRPAVFGPERPPPVAFHAAAAPPGAGFDAAFAPVAVIFGGGDGAGPAATNVNHLFALRRVLFAPRTARFFGPRLRCVAAALGRAASERRLPADLWRRILSYATATWCGDPPPPVALERTDADVAFAMDPDSDDDGLYEYDGDDDGPAYVPTEPTYLGGGTFDLAAAVATLPAAELAAAVAAVPDAELAAAMASAMAALPDADARSSDDEVLEEE